MGKQQGIRMTEPEFITIKHLLTLGKSFAEIEQICNRSKWVLSHVNTSETFADYIRKKDEIKAKRKKPEPIPEDPEPEQPAPDVWAVRVDADAAADGLRAMAYNYQFNRLMKEMDRISERLELIQRTMTALLDVWKEG